MTKPAVCFNDFVSLAVMLLMVVALVTGQSGAGAYVANKGHSIAPLVTIDNRFNIGLDGHIGDQALKISIAVVNDLSHFRGEDE